MDKALTPRQKRFCEEYLKGLNGTQAAIRAGYSKRSANPQSARLLAKDSIKAFLCKKQEKISIKAELTAEWLIRQIRKTYRRATKLGDLGPANKSLEMLGKHLGIFEDRVKMEHSVSDSDPIKIYLPEKNK